MKKKITDSDHDLYKINFNMGRAGKRNIRLAIIGAGGIAQTKYLPAIMRLRTIWEPVEIVAVSRRSEDQGKKIAKLYGCSWYKNTDEMLEKEKLDAVIVTGPDKLHTEHAKNCLRRNINVLVEKPIARSLVKAKELCEYADEKGLVLMTVANKRYSLPYVHAKEIVDHGPVTNPSLFCGKFNLKLLQGSLLESGTIHIFDLSRYFMGNVKSVHALGVKKYKEYNLDYPVDNLVTTIEFTSGSVGTIYSSSTALRFKPWERIEIYGNSNWLSIDDQHELIVYDSEQGPIKIFRPVFTNCAYFYDEEIGGFMGLVENFLEVIRGKDKPRTTGWDGYHAYELVVATQLSLNRREEVELPLDPSEADSEQTKWLKSCKF